MNEPEEQNNILIGEDQENNPFQQRDEDYFQQMYEDYSVSSTYITMRDGVQIAITLCLPVGLSSKAKVPTLLYQTRYQRTHHLRIPYRWIWNETVSHYPKTELFTANGYAVVYVDVRGCGASYGYRYAPFSEDEVKDGSEIVDWIISQPWSDGNVVTNGISYTGFTAEWLATNNHPAMKSVMMGHSGWDPYLNFIFPGGCFCTLFIQIWSFVGKQMDKSIMKEFKTITPDSWLLWKGVKPVQTDSNYSQLKQAIKEHEENLYVYDNITDVNYRDDIISLKNTGLEMIFDDLSIYRYQKELEKLNIPVYSWSSWLDADFSNVTISRFLSLNNPQIAIIGDWNHGARLPANPFHPERTAVIPSPRDRIKTEISFFNKCLKSEGFNSKTIFYYTMGEERWKKSHIWPPVGHSFQRWYLQKNNGLNTFRPEEKDGGDDYKINFRTSTGIFNRWMGPAGIPIKIPSRTKADKKLLTYTSQPLENDLEITGNPIITLYFSSTHEDGAFFVYLEDVDNDGEVTYLTEGILRLIHRKISIENPPYKITIPYHTYMKKDALPLVPNEITQAKFGLQATSVFIRKGHRLRVAIAGADKDTFARYPAEGKPIVTIERNSKNPSFIDIPIIER